MANKLKSGKYQCFYCLRQYDTPTQADACREEHKLIYVPFTKEDLMRLISFLHQKDERLLTETLTRTLLKHNRLRSE